MVLSDPSSTLVMHSSSLERDAPRVISRVQLDAGEAVWTAELGDLTQLQLAHATDSALCLALLGKDGDTTLLGLDPNSGSLLYRVDLN